MSMRELRQFWVDRIQTLDAKLDVEPHPGLFDIQELDRYATRAAAVRVAALRVPNVESRANTRITVKMGAYMLFGRDREFEADERALVIAPQVLHLVNANAESSFDQPTNIDWVNLHSSRLGSKGVHLSAITWNQDIGIAPEVDPGSLADFLIFHSEIDLGPEPDGRPEATDDTSLPQ